MKLDHIFSSLSTAYRKGHSCETTLLRLNEDWKLAIDRKELVCILSTDMSKAFDRDYIQLLGVQTECSTNFSSHISKLCKKVSKKVGILINAPAQSCSLLSSKSSISLLSCLTLPTASWYGTSVRPPTAGK